MGWRAAPDFTWTPQLCFVTEYRNEFVCNTHIYPRRYNALTDRVGQTNTGRIHKAVRQLCKGSKLTACVWKAGAGLTFPVVFSSSARAVSCERRILS